MCLFRCFRLQIIYYFIFVDLQLLLFIIIIIIIDVSLVVFQILLFI